MEDKPDIGAFGSVQVAAYELGKILPDHQKPLPLSLFQPNDVASDSQPNNGKMRSVPSG